MKYLLVIMPAFALTGCAVVAPAADTPADTATAISDWKNAGAMTTDKRGNVTMDFNTTLVNPDLCSHEAWFDYQFVGLNKGGGVVGRSGKIVKQVIYKIDCGD